MPGHEKMVSVTMAPASSAPSELQAQHRDYRDHGIAQRVGQPMPEHAPGRVFFRHLR
jgi:hypothetical protein